MLDQFFKTEAAARKVWDHAKSEHSNAVTINQGKPNEHKSAGNIHKCYHDEDPPKPCEIIEEVG